jgi:hypothetical protein
VLILPHAQQLLHKKNNSRSSLLHFKWLHNYWTWHSSHISIKPLIKFTYQAIIRVHYIKLEHQFTHQTTHVHCIKPIGVRDLELPVPKSMIHSRSLLSPHVVISWTLQAPFQSFLSSSLVDPLVRRGHAAKLFFFSNKLFPLFTSVSVLVELVEIPTFLKKDVTVTLREYLGNNITTRHWFLPISNRLYSICSSFVIFVQTFIGYSPSL